MTNHEKLITLGFNYQLLNKNVHTYTRTNKELNSYEVVSIRKVIGKRCEYFIQVVDDHIETMELIVELIKEIKDS